MEGSVKGLKFDPKNDIRRALVVAVAAAVMALNIKTFVRTGGLYPGGATGLTVLIQRIGLQYFGLEIPYSIVNLLLNAFPVYVGFRYIGTKFTLFSCEMIVLSSFMTDIIPAHPLTYDTLLISIFGGLINGCVMTMCLRVNATTGGTDFISIYLSQKRGVDSFNLVLGFNAVILLVAGYFFGWDKALYSMIFQYVSTQALHYLYRTYQQRTLFIITDMPDRVCSMIYATCGHGATLIDGEGSFGHRNKKIVYSIVSASDTRKIIPKVRDIDPNAFINSVRTEEIMGNFYTRPRD